VNRVTRAVRVRTLRADERELFKTLRLRALADSPDSFGDTLADARAQPESYWDDLVTSTTPPSPQVTFIVERDGVPVGLCFGLVDRTDATAAHLGGMWIDPVARGSGAGRALVDAVVAWARARGFARLELAVTLGNHAAERLYERAGFAWTDRRAPLASNPARQTGWMRLTL
jgi:ribosomal protein S18 acetylase RimI-like enzyme